MSLKSSEDGKKTRNSSPDPHDNSPMAHLGRTAKRLGAPVIIMPSDETYVPKPFTTIPQRSVGSGSSNLSIAFNLLEPEQMTEHESEAASQDSKPGVEVETDAPFRQEIRPLVSDDDYTRRYPNDDYGAEMGPNARVWRTYIDERDVADKEYISDNNATLDGILVFASIFSAIVATFVTETYQSLFPDPHTASQGLLAELIAVQRVAANGSSVIAIPSYESSSSTFKPGAADVWLNSLWFISLMLSLLTAFLGVLAKQWLYQYVAVTSGTPRARALVRQARSLGLHEWQVPALIGFLPIILHLSLALFLVGLIILLHSMLPNVAYFGIGVVGTVYTSYVICNILPVVYPRCPYRTALTPKLYQLYHSLAAFPRLRVALVLQQDAKAGAWKCWQFLFRLRSLKVSVVSNKSTVKEALWKDAERNDALYTRGALEANALSWLYGSSYNPTAQRVVLEAFAGLDLELDQYESNWDDDLIPRVFDDLQHGCTRLCSTQTSYKEDIDRQLELYLRALIHIQPFSPTLYHLNNELRLPLPDGVKEYYWDGRKCSHRLKTLLECGLFEGGARKPHQSFLYECTLPDGPDLSPGMWMALFRREAGYFQVLSSLRQVIEHTLTVLLKVGFFTPSGARKLVDIPSMTMQNPSRVMCEVMFSLIATCAFNGRPVDQIGAPTRVEVLLLLCSTMAGQKKRGTWSAQLSEEELCDLTGFALDCALRGVSPMDETTTAAEVWTSRETELLMSLIESDLFGDLRTPTVSTAKETIHIQVLTLVEAFVIPLHPDLISTTAFDRLSWTALLRYTYKLRPDTTVKGMYSRPPGFELLCWALKQHHVATYEDIRATNLICELQEMHPQMFLMSMPWNALWPMIPMHFLDGIPTEHERTLMNPSNPVKYADRLLDYIHQPETLYALGQLLLDGLKKQRYRLDLSRSLLRLISLRPSDHTWSPFLVQHKTKYRQMIEESEANSLDPYFREDYEIILAIQRILNIHAHNSVLDSESLEALAWDSDKQLSDDNLLLVAHRLGLKTQDAECEVIEGHAGSHWLGRMRHVLPSRKKITVPDIESFGMS